MGDREALAGDDDRLIRETGMDARIAAILMPVLRAVGFRLVRVRLSGQTGLTLQIMAERPDGTMTVEDCEQASRAISAAMDVEDPIAQAYTLEVSSPGIDRPLVRKSDFEAWRGHLVKMESSVLISGRKRFKGVLAEVDEAGVVVERDTPAYGEDPRARIPYEALGEARLVLTDDLIADALKADKKARQERKKQRRGKGAADTGEPAEDGDETTD